MATTAPATGGAPPLAPIAGNRGASTDLDKARAVEIFRKTWDVYTKVVERDYMSHVLLFDALSADMLARHGGGGGGGAGGDEKFSVVDLGCGGADALAGMLRRAPELADKIGAYTGVDLSDIALAHARANMLGGPVVGFPDVRRAAPKEGVLPQGAVTSFVEADMVSFSSSMPEKSADVILAAFALHHLAPELKEAVVEAAARALKPGGSFYYLDVWMREGEAREPYLARYRQLLDGWDALTPGESGHIWEHVSQFDFPSAESAVAASPFFEQCEVLARDGGPHALLRLTGPVTRT